MRANLHILGARRRAIQIIVTPGSGDGRARKTALRVRDALRARGHGVRLAVFPDLDRLHHWATTSDTDFSLLVCVGGDGTLDTAAAAAVRRSVPFLAVGSGFGNLFARALRQPRRVEQVIELIERGELVHVDVGARNGRLFVCQESFGLLDDIQQRTEASPARPRGRLRRSLSYYQMALKHVRDTPLAHLRVTVDGRVVAKDAAIVTVANVETYGPWLNLTPEASAIDGLLDVFVMRRTSKRDILARLIKRQLRLSGRDPGTLVCRGRRVTVAGSRRTRDEMVLMPRRLPVVVSSEAARALLREAAHPAALCHAGARQVA